MRCGYAAPHCLHCRSLLTAIHRHGLTRCYAVEVDLFQRSSVAGRAAEMWRALTDSGAGRLCAALPVVLDDTVTALDSLSPATHVCVAGALQTRHWRRLKELLQYNSSRSLLAIAVVHDPDSPPLSEADGALESLHMGEAGHGLMVSVFRVCKAAGNDEWRAGAFRKPLLMAARFDPPTASVVVEDLCSPEPMARLVVGPASDPSASPPPPAGLASSSASLPETAAQQAVGHRPAADAITSPARTPPGPQSKHTSSSSQGQASQWLDEKQHAAQLINSDTSRESQSQKDKGLWDEVQRRMLQEVAAGRGDIDVCGASANQLTPNSLLRLNPTWNPPRSLGGLPGWLNGDIISLCAALMQAAALSAGRHGVLVLNTFFMHKLLFAPRGYVYPWRELKKSLVSWPAHCEAQTP
jgi:hypothetical protein